MRFIRKGGRVIPIKDGSSTKPHTKNEKAFNNGLRAQNTGTLAVVTGLIAGNAKKEFTVASYKTGAAAITHAKIAKEAKELGKVEHFAAHKFNAQAYAHQSLGFGKIANTAKKFHKPMIAAGIALIGGGIAATGVATSREKKKYVKKN